MAAAVSKSAPAKSDEAYRSIGEAARELGLQTHVLRYWESRFPRHVKPLKRPDGRRLFRRADLDALRAIQLLVHRRGMTLKGAKALLDEQGVAAVLSGQARLARSDDSPQPVHMMQDTVKAAFAAPAGNEIRPADTFGAAAVEQANGKSAGEGSPERLRAMLAEMTDLKSRLDAARERKAA